jgi:hypothetical protein
MCDGAQRVEMAGEGLAAAVGVVKAVTQCGELRRVVTSRDGSRRHERAVGASLA